MVEIWKPIAGREGQYEVSSLGRVRGVDRLVFHNTKHNDRPREVKGVLLTPQLTPHGYYIVTFNKNSKKKTYQIHRLVAETFIPNPDNRPVVNHKNGIKTDNRIDNLEWCTYLENHHHARDILNHPAGRASKPIKCIETGVIYSSLHEAARAVNGAVKNFPRALKQGVRASGYHWEYVK